MRNMKTKKGFTLMELMVYIAILGIVVLIAGQAFTDSTRFRIRTQNIIKATQEAENVATYFKSDVSQVGAKSSKEETIAGGDDKFSDVYNEVYMDPENADDTKRDSSSFRFKPENPTSGDNLDSIIFRRIRYTPLGRYEALEEISWFLDNQILYRRCLILDKVNGSEDQSCAPKGTSGGELSSYNIVMASDVEVFQVLPAKPNVLSTDEIQIFPPSDGDEFRLVSRYGEPHYLPASIGNGGNSVTITNFASNYNASTGDINDEKNWNEVYIFANTATGNHWKTLSSIEGNYFEFEVGVEYEISFSLNTLGSQSSPDLSQMFVPGKDHMAIGLRNADGDQMGEKFDFVDDFLFYPPSTTEANTVKRIMRFSVPQTIEKANLAFTFSMFSPLVAGGNISISDFKLKRVANSAYKFNEGTTFVPTIDKQNVKAFQLKLQVKRKGETGNVNLTIPTPSNGPRD